MADDLGKTAANGLVKTLETIPTAITNGVTNRANDDHQDNTADKDPAEKPAERIVLISSYINEDMSLPPDAHHDNEWYNKRDFDGYRITEQHLFKRRKLRVICVGAGATGIQFAYKAERLLKDVDFQIYEMNNDVGGTWLLNRYPGCTCDIPSHSYQFTWAKNPNWSHYYSSSEEIWQYMKDVAVKYDLEKYIRFQHKVESATWDEEEGVWRLRIHDSDGKLIEDQCHVLINGSGVLNNWKWPNIPGIKEFKGKLMHSARWDDSYDLTGKRVAVIGGGSSSVQIIPNIQPRVGKLYAYLRSPVWITTGFGAKYAGPGGTNFEYSEDQIKEFNDEPQKHAEYSRAIEGELNKRFALMHLRGKDQKASRDLVADIMSEQLQHDPVLTKHMIPPFALGCRRMTPGSGYLQSLRASNVEVVPKSVTRLTEKGIIDEDGNEREVDVVVCATGFTTSFAPHFQVYGRNNAEIHKQFGDFPVGYMGIAVQNFPNFYLFIGPNGPASHSSLLPVLEWYTRYVFQVIEKLQTEHIKAVDPKPEAVKDLYNHTHELMKRLAWSSPCSSWFKNGKTHGPVTAIYAGSRLHFFEMLKNARWEDYNITYRTNNRYQFMGNGFTETEIDPDADPVWYFDDPFVRV